MGRELTDSHERPERGHSLGDWTPSPGLPVAVTANLGLSGVHGLSHSLASVPAEPWQFAVLAVGLLVAPLVALSLARRGRDRAAVGLAGGGALLALAMEGPWHFLLANPDHVAHAGGEDAFLVTAVLTVAGDLAVVLVALHAGRAVATTGNW